MVFLFFARLFFPPSIFVTPDFGHSDLIHFNIPIKTIMWESLRQGKIPLWDSRIGQGFPVFDEGQIGFFYLPNMILFGLLPFWLAFNLGYIVTFSVASLGAFYFARSLKLSQAASYLVAITFAFNPLMVLHLHHYNLIQTVSVIPILFLLIQKFFDTKRVLFIFLFSLAFSQQMLTGFPQIVIYSLVLVGLFILYKTFKLKIKMMKKLLVVILFFIGLSLGLLISVVQIAASYQLTQEAKRASQLTPQKLLSEFPLVPSNLLTLLNPYIQGDPKMGTYPIFRSGKWGIFWESNFYFGITQLVLVLSIILYAALSKKRRSRADISFWALTSVIGILLALGSSSPLHPIFSIPPFSLFRVPARFLILSFMSFAILSGLSLEKLSKSKHSKIVLLSFLLVFIATIDIFRVWYSYNMLGKIDTWLKKPAILDVPMSFNDRVLSLNLSSAWNNIFTKKGWAGEEKNYNFLLNFLAENSNINYGVQNANVYAAMQTKRKSLVNAYNNFDIKNQNGKTIIGDISQKIFDIQGINYLTSQNPIESGDWQKINKVTSDNNSVYLSYNSSALGRAFAVTNYEVATTIQKADEILQNNNFNPRTTVILEKDPGFRKDLSNPAGLALITKDSNTEVVLEVNLDHDSIVVLSDSYYPGWKAYIGDKETEIFAANLNSKAVIVPKGKNQIRFVYQRDDIKYAFIVSAIAFIATISLAILNRNKKINL